jgi:hypothetical protein
MRSTPGIYIKLLVAGLALPVMAAPAAASTHKAREAKQQVRHVRAAEPASTGTLRRAAPPVVETQPRAGSCNTILCSRYTLIGVGF